MADYWFENYIRNFSMEEKIQFIIEYETRTANSTSPLKDRFVREALAELDTWPGVPKTDLHQVPFRKLNRIIETGSAIECLTSPRLYIRECKKFYIEVKGRLASSEHS